MSTDKYSSDFALAAGQSIKERDYWLKKLSGNLEKTVLPYDSDRIEPKPGGPEITTFQISGELFTKLNWISNNTDILLLAVLAGAINLLINKYTENTDIIIGMPIYKQNITGDFINTVLAIRTQLHPKMTFKELLYQVKTAVDEAVKNQNYPIKALLYDLGLPYNEEDFPLFDITLTVENLQDRKYITHIHTQINFSFLKTDRYLEGKVAYNSLHYRKDTVARIIDHFTGILREAIYNVNTGLTQISPLSEAEKKRLMEEFNNTQRDFPGADKKLPGIFADQVERTPDQIALVFDHTQLSYRAFNEKAHRLAGLLREKGIGANCIAALLMESSLAIPISVMGVLKAGGAYLPIDPGSPEERIDYMLKDSGASVLISKSEIRNPKFETNPNKTNSNDPNKNQNSGATLVLNFENLNFEFVSNFDIRASNLIPSNLAYIIYTSGSTGKPKGVMVEHKQAVNTLMCRKDEYKMSRRTTALQLFSYAFDGFVTGFFTPLFSGAVLVLLSRRSIEDISKIINIISTHQVTHFISVPVLYQAILGSITEKEAASLQVVTLAGDKLPPDIAQLTLSKNNKIEIVNEYGITEAAVMSTIYRNQQRDSLMKIGHPIWNTKIYITHPGAPGQIKPIGVHGEICLAGAGLARGYMNNPGLTASKFVENPFTPGEKLLRTGDMGRWLPDGNIEFTVRIDLQVKVRGFRIELGEIERRLITHTDIKEAVVTAYENESHDKYLCAYIISGRSFSVSELREYLSGYLPEYMIPSYFVTLESLPLLPSGKIDKKRLPLPEISSDQVYVAPRNRVEKIMARIWSEVLGIEEDHIGIETNFFELGGHSLTATLLTNAIHRELNVRIPMIQVFQSPVIKSMAEYVYSATKETYTAIEKAEKKEYYPVSSAQNRLYILQQIVLNSMAYNVSSIFELEGELDKEKLARTFRQLICRQDGFRTSFFLEGPNPVQRVHPEEEIQFEIKYHLLNAGDDENTINEMIREFIRPFNLAQPPLLRVELIKTGPLKHILMVDMHHIITDGVSYMILLDEFQALYDGNTLPPPTLQYIDYAQWQQSEEAQKHLDNQKKYWVNEFAGEIPVLNMPIDYERPLNQGFEGDVINFEISAEENSALQNIADSQGATTFMVLLAIYNIFLVKISNQDDIVVGTPIAGRRHADLNQIIGIFINMLALRCQCDSQGTFSDFLEHVKEKTIAAFDNQDYPFESIVENLSIVRDTSRNPLFDAAFSYYNTSNPSTGNVEARMTDLSIRPYTNGRKSAQFDFTLQVTETANNKLNFSIEYCTKLFKAETIRDFIQYFKIIISSLTATPEKKISEIEILLAEEKARILSEFNNTDAEYPYDRTIRQIFESQAQQNPDRIAVIDPACQVTYRELNEKSARLSGLLKQKGVEADTLVGLKIERSPEMIIGIMGILKAGGAYVPINPEHPQDLIHYILSDCAAKIVLTRETIIKAIQVTEPILYNLPRQSHHLVYVIYTSGSTGRPKGVMIEHHSLVNRLHWMQKAYAIDPNDTILQKTTFTFDVSVWEIFWWTMTGARLCLLKQGGEKSPESIVAAIQKYNITIMHFVPSMLSVFLNYLEENAYSPVKSLRQVFSSGEALTVSIVERFNELLFKKNSTKLANLYGPTEATIDVSYFNCVPGCNYKSIPIGRPIDNTRLLILDKFFKLQPVGIPGELFIGGVGLSRGYLNRAELTTEKFIQAEHLGLFKNGKWYRTGDLARWMPDGTPAGGATKGIIEFLGRSDTQVKIRGFRIELDEIERQLGNHKDIETAVVICNDGNREDKYLCAFIVGNFDRNRGGLELKNFLANTLPSYMIPSHFVFLDQIPLTSNGKINRKALLETKIQINEEYMAPTNAIEEKLTAIWAEILGIEKNRMSTTSNFFELGGHSLKATLLIIRMHKEFDVRVPLAEVFKTPRIKDLAKYIQEMNKELYISIEPAEKKEYYHLSSAQKRLYILHKMDPDNIAYNMPSLIPISAASDPGKIEETFIKLIKRHESLRTSFHMVDNTPVQVVHDEVEFNLACNDSQTFINQFIRPFDLTKAPLIRAALIKEAGGQHILLVDMHHIISDGVSHEVLINDFLSFYEGRDLLPLRIQYKDFSQWQEGEKEKENLNRQEKFWLTAFAGEIPVLELPTDYPRPVQQSFEGNNIHFKIKEETQGLKAMALAEGSTLFMALTAIYTILLSKLSGQEEIIIGTPIAGRRHADLEKIIGMFVNTLSLKNTPAGDRTFREFIRDVKQRTLMAFENQEYPFEELVEKLSVSRDIGRNPLFDVMFLFETMNTDGGGRGGSGEEDVETRVENNPQENENIFQPAKFDLTLSAEERGVELFLSFQYCTKLFKKETLERFIEYFKKIVSIIVKEPGIKISEIEIISDEEKQRILNNFNNTEAAYPNNKTIHQLFEEQVDRTPDNIAVIGAAASPVRHVQPVRSVRPLSLTYRQLNEQSGHLAGLLIEKGVLADTIVGIMMERSVEMIIGIYGILKAGGAYLPIDPGYPQERIDFMLKDSGARILINKSEIRNPKFETNPNDQNINVQNKNRHFGIPFVLNFEHLNFDIVSNFVLRASDLNSSNLAYIIYTSGSTGNPKGVIIEHHSLVNRLNWMQKAYPLDKRDTILQKTTFTFDVSVWEIFWWSIVGARLCLLLPGGEKDPGLITQTVARNNVTTMHFVPSMLSVFLDYLKRSGDITKLSGLKQVIASGEALLPVHVEQFNELLNKENGAQLANLYGPTEATIDVSYFDCLEKNEKGPIPIGKPIDNISLYILDKHLHIQPVGISGELCISGIGLARGYINRPELTHDKFKIINYKLKIINGSGTLRADLNAFGDEENFHHSSFITHHSLLYRTGDLARWLPNGNIEFLGRIDHQVKIRGFRIELGEIENSLLKVSGIKEAVVVAPETDRDDKYLCAYFVSERVCGTLELREILAKQLPDYMIPSYFVQVEKIPLTANGKIDRRALPLPEAGGIGNMGSEYIPPANEIEEKLTQIWSELLGIEKEKISTLQNFFESGGTSLSLIRQLSMIYNQFGFEVNAAQIYQSPTIQAIAKAIQSKKYVEQSFVLLNRPMPKKLFCFPPGVGFGLVYQGLANIMNDYSLYSFNFIEDENRLHEYVEVITNLQPTGPYTLFGWSAAGKLVFKVAGALENLGFEVADIILADCFWRKDDIKEENDDAMRPEDLIFLEQIERQMEEFGLGYLKEKVGRKTKKYLEYIRDLNTLEGIHSQVHLIISEEFQHDEAIDRRCWDELTAKTVVTYNGFGNHSRMFSEGPLEKNAELIRKILERSTNSAQP